MLITCYHSNCNHIYHKWSILLLSQYHHYHQFIHIFHCNLYKSTQKFNGFCICMFVYWSIQWEIVYKIYCLLILIRFFFFVQILFIFKDIMTYDVQNYCICTEGIFYIYNKKTKVSIINCIYMYLIVKYWIKL